MIGKRLNCLLTMCDDSSNEYIISSYFLKNYSRIIELKLTDVIKEIGISKSTLSRYCQSLGYKNYTEFQYDLFFTMSHPKKYNTSFKMIDNSLKDLVVNKKRIIVLGDEMSLSPLLIYKSLFLDIGISMEIKLKYQNPIELLDSYNITGSDLLIYVSLYKNNMELVLERYQYYNDILKYTLKNHINMVYIGKVSKRKKDESYYFSIKENKSKSEEIKDLCDVFENIYFILKQSINQKSQ